MPRSLAETAVETDYAPVHNPVEALLHNEERLTAEFHYCADPHLRRALTASLFPDAMLWRVLDRDLAEAVVTRWAEVPEVTQAALRQYLAGVVAQEAGA